MNTQLKKDGKSLDKCCSANIDDYATFTEEMWFDHGPHELTERDFTIMSLGLAGEVGEVMEILKKRTRDGHLNKDDLIKELGDVAYYWARMCRAFDLKPSDVLAANKQKLISRKERGVLRGSGDHR